LERRERGKRRRAENGKMKSYQSIEQASQKEKKGLAMSARGGGLALRGRQKGETHHHPSNWKTCQNREE